MTNDKSLSAGLRLLGHFWLEEVKAEDWAVIAAAPPLAETLPERSAETLDRLAVEYQRLFGFNVPPYESVFIDPAAMLMTPAAERVQALYRRGGWRPPGDVRTAGPDHLGLELLALAAWLETGRPEPAHHLHTRHLALWVPPFILTLARLKPAAFYSVLAELTLDLILTTLPERSVSPETLFPAAASPEPESKAAGSDQQPEEPLSLRRLLRRLLSPRQTGLFLTREDLAHIGRALELPGVMGDRFRMLDSLFRLAGQYDLLPALFDQLGQVVLKSETAYQNLANEYPAWSSYAQAWREQLAATKAVLDELKIISGQSPAVRSL